VSAVSPPGVTLPTDGKDIPHVAADPGDDAGGLPPGERCYWCDVGAEEEIALERRPSDRHYTRYRRHANYTRALPV